MGDPARPRTAVMVGPYLSGKTTLIESLLFACQAIPKRGSVKEGTTVGDGSPESRARKMSLEVSAASASYLGDPWTFIDTPGSIELMQEARNALMVADVAVVVCEAVVDRVQTLAPIMRFLDEQAIPHMLFVNKMDQATASPKQLLEALQALTDLPLVLRQVPIHEGEALTGYVDLVSERAYRYRPGKPSDLIKLPETALDQEKSARSGLLEALADFDDTLLEALLEDTVPPPKEIYKQLTKDLQEDKIVPVFLGAAEFENGVRRLLKALRHETPGPEATAARRGLKGDGEPVAEVFKTYHAAHTGKLTLARMWRGSVKDGQTLNGARVSGLYRMTGVTMAKLPEAKPGDVVAFGRMESITTGTALTPSGTRPPGMRAFPPTLPPQFALAIAAENRNDEVKLSGAMAKLSEEDPSLSFSHEHDTGELVLHGQGDIHLQIAMERLKNKYNLKVRSRRPRVPYKETIRKGVAQHGRHKRQSGGHGQFGDIKVEIKPLPRGEGFVFIDKIVGGSIPRQYIPSVEEGIRDYMSRGPLGFHLVDFAVTLLDGQYHAVDSSDMAFKTAARIAMTEGMPKCDPVLLEPIAHVTISVPNDHTSKVQRVITGRRGQILGFDAKPGWKGWDEVTAYMPQSEIHDLIVDIRSLTLGVASYVWKFDHLSELTGRLADKVIEDHAPKAAAAS